MSGKKGASGRRKTPATIIKEAYDLVDNNMPALFRTLYARAIEGDREALIYLIDRRLGKPKSSTEIDIAGGEQLGAGVVKLLMEAVINERKRLEGENATQRQGDSQKLLEGEEASTEDVQP